MKIKIMCLAFALAFFATATNAEEGIIGNPEIKKVTVATVGVSDASVLSQNGSELKISFDVTNREGAQPGLRYAMVLFKQEGQEMKVVDRKVFDDVFSISEGASMHKEISYAAPSALRGKFIPTIEISNSEGFIFVTASLSEINLEGVNQSIYISPDSCKIFVGDDRNNGRILQESVDIKKGEAIFLSCEVENSFNVSKAVKPQFSVHYRSLFGREILNQSGDSVQLEALQKKTLEMKVPIADQPQSYALSVNLAGDNSSEISNSVQFIYNIQGELAAIQNVILDRDYYRAGDVAKFKIFFLGQAEGGLPKGTIDGGKILVSLKNGKGAYCSKSESFNQGSDMKNEYEIGVTADCIDPQISLEISSPSGEKLASQTFNVKTAEKLRENQAEIGKTSNTKKAIYVLGGILFFALIVSWVLIFLKKKGIIFGVLIMGLACAGSFMISGLAHGENGGTTGTYSTDTTNMYNGATLIFTTRANLNKSSDYAEGESATISSSATFYLGASDRVGVTQDWHKFGSGALTQIYSAIRTGLNGATITFPNYVDVAPSCPGCTGVSNGTGVDCTGARCTFGESTAGAGANGSTHMGGHFSNSTNTTVGVHTAGCSTPSCVSGILGNTEFSAGASIGLNVPNPISSTACGSANGFTTPSGSYSDANKVWLLYPGGTSSSRWFCSTATNFPPRTLFNTSTGQWSCLGQDGGSSVNCSVSFTYSCTGATPSNATLCAGDNTGLSANTTNTLASACGAPKCEYTCNSGYTLSGGVCVASTSYSCTGSVPTNAGAYDAEESSSLAANTPWLYSATDTATKCQYRCTVGSWQGSYCGYTCGGSVATNGQSYGASEITNIFSPTNWSYAALNTANKCQFYCKSGYVWDGSDCVSGSCTYSNHTCDHTDSVDCSNTSNCEQTNNRTASCLATSSCGGTVSIPVSDCIAAGVACADDTVTCPDCAPSDPTGENVYREVAP